MKAAKNIFYTVFPFIALGALLIRLIFGELDTFTTYLYSVYAGIIFVGITIGMWKAKFSLMTIFRALQGA